jgi:hypothetical protein
MPLKFALILTVRSIIFISLLIIFQPISCKNDSSLIDPSLQDNPRPDCETCSILFIGSSALSYDRSDVVKIFLDLSREGNKPVEVHDWIVGGHHFSDHCKNQMTIDKINERNWDYVILQGSVPYISKEKWHHLIVPYLKELIDIIEIRSINAYVVYMMPWAFKDGLEWMEGETDNYEQMQENIYYNTTKLATELDIATAPVGWAWYNAITSGYDKDLFLSDYTHASKYGAYLTACVFYSTIFLETPPIITYNWEDEDNPHYLNEVASSTVLSHLDLWNIY